MRNIILEDNVTKHTGLLPLTFTRPVAELTVGIDTIHAKWERLLDGRYSWRTTDYLSELFPEAEAGGDNIVIDSSIIPDHRLAEAIDSLQPGCELVRSDGRRIALRYTMDPTACESITYDGEIREIGRPYDIFELCGEEIVNDLDYRKAISMPQTVSDTCTVIGSRDLVFIEPGATVEGVTLNTTKGPIYIGEGAEVMEGSCLRGPVAIGESATVNMLTRIYGATSIGAHCKVGGEINNAVMLPYSNKAHDGFLGNAVIGSWCNLGAGCVASNLKNDYTEIKLWDYTTRRFARTGLQFCGLIMGDHSKAGINTMFNTATVVGVGVNIHGTGFPRNFVASFSEGSAVAGFSDVPLSKFFAIAERVMARRDIKLSDAERRLFTRLHEITETYK